MSGTIASPAGQNEQADLGLVKVAQSIEITKLRPSRQSGGRQHLTGSSVWDIGQALLTELVSLAGLVDLGLRQGHALGTAGAGLDGFLDTQCQSREQVLV